MAGEMNVRFATVDDKEWCQKIDSHVSDDVYEFKTGHDEIIVGELDGKKVGYLRLEYWYLTLPFLGLIVVEEEYRRRGVGGAMLAFLEKHLAASGHDCLYSSSDVNEAQPQAWHRHMGFKDCGIISGMNENGVGEVIFRKGL
ncbi:MAG: GNAT family N-acetyltransferase, partial [Methanobacteriota archaeon]